MYLLTKQIYLRQPLLFDHLFNMSRLIKKKCVMHIVLLLQNINVIISQFDILYDMYCTRSPTKPYLTLKTQSRKKTLTGFPNFRVTCFLK